MTKQKTDTILISIHPQHVENILLGTKRFELRRCAPDDIKRIVIYATAPESRVAAIAAVDEVLSDTPRALWRKVRDAACVTHDFYQGYFKDSPKAFALRIGNIYPLTGMISLKDPNLRLCPPQSFCYLDAEKTNWLINCAKPTLSCDTQGRC